MGPHGPCWRGVLCIKILASPLIMEDFNTTQKRLIEAAERAHYYGLRHKGLSGSVCEDALIDALRESVPSLHFDRGVIKFADRNIFGNDLKTENLSTQLDIIIYSGEPIYKAGGNAVVHADDVLGVIEIKKWANPKMITYLSTCITDTEKKISKKIRTLFVAFRFHDRSRNGVTWRTQIKNFPTPYSYCFSGTFSRENKVNLYPWEEKWWSTFDTYTYAGEYEKMVREISEMNR